MVTRGEAELAGGEGGAGTSGGGGGSGYLMILLPLLDHSTGW